VTRSLSLGAPAPAPTAAASEEGAFIESLKSRTTRSLSRGERQKLAEIAADKPSIDLEIPFDFNSAQIGPKAMPAIKNLGAALANPQLKGGTFVIAGHTDAKGSDPANQTLSERRAEAVKRYLVENYKIAPENLLSVGYGESRLKNSGNPLADENRRVQATNVTETKSAAAR
jgi:outer membrane protein OmpA-like peptidoglycan-associated protein